MKKKRTPDFLTIDKPEDRRKAVEELLKELSRRSEAVADNQVPIDMVKSRYQFSCSMIMYSSILATVALSLAGLYFMMLPRPEAYVTTQEGKLYEMTPYKIER